MEPGGFLIQTSAYVVLLQPRLRKDLDEPFLRLAEHDDSREDFFGLAVGKEDLARGNANFCSGV